MTKMLGVVAFKLTKFATLKMAASFFWRCHFQAQSRLGGLSLINKQITP